MPSYRAVYSGDYLKAEDILGKRIPVTIDTIALKAVQKDEDPQLILSFVGKQKQLILNKTNAQSIGDLYGDDYDHWVGRSIMLFTVPNVYQGKPGIRVDAPPAGHGGDAHPAPPPPPDPHTADDSVPF